MAQPSIQGRFVWQELVTEDPAAAVGFYGKVLGWRAQASPHEASYTVFSTGSGPLAGATTLKAEARAQGTKPHWLIHIGADDIDATLATAVRLGAKVLLAATDLPQVGRYAVLSDPYGAAFALYKPIAPHADRPAKAGEHIWLELGTSDLEGAFKFYQGVFGWQDLHRMDMGAMGTYLIFGKSDTQRGGIFKLAPGAPGPAWTSYIEVADVEKAIAAATKAGGRLVNGPHPVPGGRIAQLLDPGGVAFAIHTQAKKVETPAPPPSAPAAAPAKPAATPAKPAAAKPAAATPAAATSAAATPPSAPKAAAPATATPPVVKPAPRPAATVTPAAPVAKPAAAPAKPAAAPAKSVAAPAKKKAAPVKTAAKKKAASKPASAKKAAKKVAKKAAKKAKKKVAKKKVAKKKKAAARKKVAARASVSARKSARPAAKKAKPAMVKKDKKKKKKDKKRRKKEKARRKK